MIVERFVEANGLRIAYRETGEPGSPPLILLHAMGPDATDWDPVAQALADSFRIFAIHQRGFGPGQRPKDYGFEHMRDDVLAFAAALGLETFALMGHSMGGTVAYLVAEKAPERVVRLVVEDTPPPWGNDMPDAPETPERPVPFDWQAWRAIVHQLKFPDPRWWDELPEISCPTLIIGGGSTSHVPRDMLVRVSKLIPDARLVTFEGAGHNVHANRLEEFLAEVRKFLAG